jgi:hypothetical protein
LTGKVVCAVEKMESHNKRRKRKIILPLGR